MQRVTAATLRFAWPRMVPVLPRVHRPWSHLWSTHARFFCRHKGESVHSRSGVAILTLKELRLVSNDGTIGIMPPTDALHIAQERGMILVEVAPSAVPPVWKLIVPKEEPETREQQQQQQRSPAQQQHEPRNGTNAAGSDETIRRPPRPGKPAKPPKVKEVRLTDRCETRDAQTKAMNAMRFLSKGQIVKLIGLNSGRVCPDTGRPRAISLIEQIAKECEDLIDGGWKLSGASDSRGAAKTAGRSHTKGILGEVTTILTPKALAKTRTK